MIMILQFSKTKILSRRLLILCLNLCIGYLHKKKIKSTLKMIDLTMYFLHILSFLYSIKYYIK